MENKLCAYCGKIFSGEGWPHVEGDSNRGVLKIEQFCSEEHKYNFLSSELWVKCVPSERFCVLVEHEFDHGYFVRGISK